MTTRHDFTPAEWDQILEGPPSAGMVVITAARGGIFRETVSMAKAYAQAREQHGQSELLDEVVAAKPKYRHFVVNLAERVAIAHREKGNEEAVSEPERAAIEAITQALATGR
jgi:hypothetical protein